MLYPTQVNIKFVCPKCGFSKTYSIVGWEGGFTGMALIYDKNTIIHCPKCGETLQSRGLAFSEKLKRPHFLIFELSSLLSSFFSKFNRKEQ